jgi:hypothetical protein
MPTRFVKGNTIGSDTRFKPGVSGNPGGRPACANIIRALAQTHAEEMYELLLGKARDGDRVAMVEILSLAGCRMTVTITDPVIPGDSPLDSLSDEEIMAKARREAGH